MRATFMLAVSASLILAAAPIIAAQDKTVLPPPPLPIDPTPLVKLITEQERTTLADARKPKKLVEVYLDIADAHLETAFTALKAGQGQESQRQLDIYNKAMAEAAKNAFSQGEGKRGLAKKIEQRLYKQIRVLEEIKDSFPVERLPFAEAALKQSRQLRVQALNESFDSDVLKEPGAEKKSDKPEGDKEKSPKSPLPPLARSFAAQGFAAGSPARSTQIPGDYLTDEEDQHVREAQKADDRVKVFMKIADRRLGALSPAPVAATDKKAHQKAEEKAEEEERQWGAVPKVSRSQLLLHYARAVREVIAKLEDAYERNPKSSAIPKALTILRDSTDRHLQIIRALEPEMKSDSEIAAWREALDQAETANKGARDGLAAKQ
ncbi:MAG TPA: hypothetical protein VKA70_15905 [Blastocatellia bacterium]|nr:hypothetical protein [Blastocatellia bacterium]